MKSAKDAFFPQSENLYTVRKENKKLKIEPEKLKEQNFVVFGMKACDVKGVEVLDKVFLSDPVDSFYAARREHGTIVAMACHEPEETCFCKVFGIDAAAPAADVATWMIGEDLYWKALTEKGEKLTETVKELLVEADEQPVEAEKDAIHKIVEKLPYMIFSGGWEEMHSLKNLILQSGKNYITMSEVRNLYVLYVRPVSVMTLRITIPVTVYPVTAAGIPACILILQ